MNQAEFEALPGANLARALAWFVKNESRIDAILNWFEDNKTDLAALIVKINMLLSFVKHQI